jgi:hypothetical protein
MSKTELSNMPKAEDKFIAVVVLPTPPFWFAIAIVFDSDI